MDIVTAIETFECLPAGWIVLDVYRREARSRDWTALVVNIHPHSCPPGALRQGLLPVPAGTKTAMPPGMPFRT